LLYIWVYTYIYIYGYIYMVIYICMYISITTTKSTGEKPYNAIIIFPFSSFYFLSRTPRKPNWPGTHQIRANAISAYFMSTRNCSGRIGSTPQHALDISQKHVPCGRGLTHWPSELLFPACCPWQYPACAASGHGSVSVRHHEEPGVFRCIRPAGTLHGRCTL